MEQSDGHTQSIPDAVGLLRSPEFHGLALETGGVDGDKRQGDVNANGLGGGSIGLLVSPTNELLFHATWPGGIQYPPTARVSPFGRP